MAKQPATQTKAVETVEGIPVMEVQSTSDMLQRLWGKAQPHLTPADLTGLTRMSTAVHSDIGRAGREIGHMVNLIAEDEDSGGDSMKASELMDQLWSLSDQLQTLSTLAFIVGEANFMLQHPEWLPGRRKAGKGA